MKTKNDTELDALVAECEKCKSDLTPTPPSFGATEGEATATKAVDPATVIAIVDVVLKLIAKWRDRK